jgi:hypothetical protein
MQSASLINLNRSLPVLYTILIFYGFVQQAIQCHTLASNPIPSKATTLPLKPHTHMYTHTYQVPSYGQNKSRMREGGGGEGLLSHRNSHVVNLFLFFSFLFFSFLLNPASYL